MSQVTSQRLVAKSITGLADLAEREVRECEKRQCCGGVILLGLTHRPAENARRLLRAVRNSVVDRLGDGYNVLAVPSKAEPNMIDLQIIF